MLVHFGAQAEVGRCCPPAPFNPVRLTSRGIRNSDGPEAGLLHHLIGDSAGVVAVVMSWSAG
jgi:hypothetical protein